MIATLFNIPGKKIRIYQTLRVGLYGIFLSAGFMLAYSFLFPSQSFSFDFRNPDAAKNTFLDPRLNDNTELKRGLLPENTPLIFNSGALGFFSEADILVKRRKDSPKPTELNLSLRKGPRAGFLPIGESAVLPPWKSFQADTYQGYRNGGIFFIENEYYQFFNGTLYRFVSNEAFRSSYPESAAIEQTKEILNQFPLSNEFIGFRSGSLLSFADGVFVVYGNDTIRPVGSADIFTALGYRWEDIIPASEEEIGIYQRGKILLPGVLHAPGTLFADHEVGKTYLLGEDQKLHPLDDPALLSFLISKQHPIEISRKNTLIQEKCMLKASFFFSQSYTCNLPFSSLIDLPGSDYEFALKGDTPLSIESLEATFKRTPTKENFSLAFGQLKQRFIDRYSR